MDIFFSDYFQVAPERLEEYGAFNISLVTDFPLFIDPFLLFNSDDNKYKELHESIIKYLIFLRKKSKQEQSPGDLSAWYTFREVKQNWLGFSVMSNKGSGLGMNFAKSLSSNLHRLFPEDGQESITQSSHLEKLCLIKEGVGKDKISDFVTNLIKESLLKYTEQFAKEYIDESLRETCLVERVRFNYKTESWMDASFNLPVFNNDFVILTPKDLLRKDETWINKKDLLGDFERIQKTILDNQLRSQLDNYIQKRLNENASKKKKPTKREKDRLFCAPLNKYPEVLDYFIKDKEDNGHRARGISDEDVSFIECLYVKNVQNFFAGLENIDLNPSAQNSYEEAKKKISILKDYIENNDGYKIFYSKDKRIRTEGDLQIMFGLVCCQSSIFDVNREVNNGRGYVDFVISRGSGDKTLVEFKLAKSTKLELNLQNQVPIYEKANYTSKSFIVIIYFSKDEKNGVRRMLKKLNRLDDESIVLIDAQKDNKPSASIATVH